MGQIKWYKRDPGAALNGMMELTLEERGAYNTVLDLIYSRDGNLVDDDRFIAGWLRVDVRVWKRIKCNLIARGKLFVADGLIRNARADVEVLEALSRVGSAREAGLASARSKASKSNAAAQENKDLGSTVVETPASTPVPTNHNHNHNTLDTDVSNDPPPENPPPAEPPNQGGSDPAPPSAIDITKAIFDAGVAILRPVLNERRARAVIGKWKQAYGPPAVLDVLARAEVERPQDPISWITASLHARATGALNDGQSRAPIFPPPPADPGERAMGRTEAAAREALNRLLPNGG